METMAKYIDRDALLEHLKKDPLFDLVERYGISGVIESFPAADVRPVRRGKWVHEGSDVWRCSECDYGIMPWNAGVNFCPNCGAEMREEN